MTGDFKNMGEWGYSCGKCRYWQKTEKLVSAGDDTIIGKCRRHPPQMIDDEARVLWMWPDTWETHWCGEYGDRILDPDLADE